jgi:hypothetical protein
MTAIEAFRIEATAEQLEDLRRGWRHALARPRDRR